MSVAVGTAWAINTTTSEALHSGCPATGRRAGVNML